MIVALSKKRIRVNILVILVNHGSNQRLSNRAISLINLVEGGIITGIMLVHIEMVVKRLTITLSGILAIIKFLTELVIHRLADIHAVLLMCDKYMPIGNPCQELFSPFLSGLVESVERVELARNIISDDGIERHPTTAKRIVQLAVVFDKSSQFFICDRISCCKFFLCDSEFLKLFINHDCSSVMRSICHEFIRHQIPNQ